MDVSTVLAMLTVASEAASVGSFTIAAAKAWLSRQLATEPSIDPALCAALARLPADAKADDIVKVLQPFYEHDVGQPLIVKAGSDGGGSATFEGTHIAGAIGGGPVVVGGGDGGANGRGGDFTMVGGSITGSPGR